MRHRLAQILEIGGIDREQPAEHHRLRRLEARQRLGGRVLLVRDGVADARIGHLLDGGGEEADLARAELVQHLLLGAEDADALDLIGCRPYAISLIFWPFFSVPSMMRTSTTTPR